MKDGLTHLPRATFDFETDTANVRSSGCQVLATARLGRSAKRFFAYCIRRCHVDLAGRYAFTTADGCRFWLHNEVESHSLWINSGIQECDDVEVFLCDYLREGDTFVDVGANIGRYAIRASRLVGNSGRVYAFEPARSAFRALQQNLELNHCGNVQVLCLAVAENEGPTDFWEYSRSSTLNGMFARVERRDACRSTCEAITGTRALQLIAARIDLLKIDVEGAELPVLRSFGERLREIRCILFECSRANFRRAGYTIPDLLWYLQKTGRSLYELGHRGQEFCAVNPSGYDTDNKNLIAVFAAENLRSQLCWRLG